MENGLVFARKRMTYSNRNGPLIMQIGAEEPQEASSDNRIYILRWADRIFWNAASRDLARIEGNIKEYSSTLVPISWSLSPILGKIKISTIIKESLVGSSTSHASWTWVTRSLKGCTVKNHMQNQSIFRGFIEIHMFIEYS